MGSRSLSLRAAADDSGVTTPLATTVLNFVLFQVGWFACVLSAAAERPVIGVLVATGVLAFHLWRASAPREEMRLILLALAIGAVWESLLVWQDLLRYQAGVLVPNFAPYWIVMMWGLFATVPNVSLRWLKGRWLVASVAGLVGGPMAFYAGQRMGALEFGHEPAALSALALGWAVLTPLLMALSVRFDGYAPAASGGSS